MRTALFLMIEAFVILRHPPGGPGQASGHRQNLAKKGNAGQSAVHTAAMALSVIPVSAMLAALSSWISTSEGIGSG